VIEGEERHGPGSYVVFAPGSRHRPRTETGARMLGVTVLPADSSPGRATAFVGRSALPHGGNGDA
jgi:hypothetical protein